MCQICLALYSALQTTLIFYLSKNFFLLFIMFLTLDLDPNQIFQAFFGGGGAPGGFSFSSGGSGGGK